MSYTVDEEITKQLVKDGKGVALLRCDEAHEIEKSGLAYIWNQGTVSVSFGLAYMSDQKGSSLIKTALAAILGVWGRGEYGSKITTRDKYNNPHNRIP